MQAGKVFFTDQKSVAPSHWLIPLYKKYALIRQETCFRQARRMLSCNESIHIIQQIKLFCSAN